MKKNVLLRTNIFISVIIIAGFLITSIISYNSNSGALRKDVEHISTLTSEGIFYQIDAIFTKPINISLTMANDTLLKSLLAEENDNLGSEEYIATVRDYLNGYKDKYNYDSVFLISTSTNRYYHFEQGVDRIMTKDNPENVWYYTFLNTPKEYYLNIDNDEVKFKNNEITIFINCKILSPEGKVMGIVGVGFGVDTLQKIFHDYEEKYNVRAYLVDEEGNIAISTTKTGYVSENLFENCGYADRKEDILSDFDNALSFWYSNGNENGFLISQFVDNLDWHLIIDNDTSVMMSKLNRQFFVAVVVIVVVIFLVLIFIINIIRKYNREIVDLTIDKEKYHRTVFQVEAEKLYEDIYELDITHNRAASEATENYFESLGASKSMTFDETLRVIAMKQIKEEYREGYISTFCTSNVLKAYREGMESLSYEFMITNDGQTYYWMRITARIFFWEEDQSVRMIVFRQNIDQEKRREKFMEEKILHDSLSGLYNKAATQELIRKALAGNPYKPHAFFIIDIDCFKTINDTCGHAFGDLVITDFAGRIRHQFRENDIVGRIGGDEFVVFVNVPSPGWLEDKASALTCALTYNFTDGEKSSSISASIGIAVSPVGGRDFETLYQNADCALYRTKKKGKKGYTIYE